MLAASTGLDYPIINEGLQKRLLTGGHFFTVFKYIFTEGYCFKCDGITVS